MAPTSHEEYKRTLRYLEEHVGLNLILAELRVEDIEDYQVRRVSTVAKATTDWEIGVFRNFLNWCLKRRWVRENWASSHYIPSLVPARIRKRHSRRRSLSEEELGRLLDPPAKWHHYRPVFWALYYTGMRIQEIGHLQDRDIDLTKRRIKVRSKTALVPYRNPETRVWEGREVAWRVKFDEDREIPIFDPLYPVLEEFHRARAPNVYRLYFLTTSGALITDHLSRQVKEITENERASVHWLRHTFISHALNRWGVPATVVQQLAGHRDLATTQIYIHTDYQDLERWADRIR